MSDDTDTNTSRRGSLRNRENGLAVVQNGKEEKKTQETSPSNDQQEQRSKLRNRESIAKPETLQYEPNFNKGFHVKLMQSLFSEPLKSKQKKTSPNNNHTANKRKSRSPTGDKQNGVKKSKPELKPQIEEYFDSYTFSMQLINTEDDTIIARKGKDITEKNVLLIGNLPLDVTREQLEEHFRKTGGIKAIRIPRDRGSDKGRGFAYMEFDGRISLGIALRLHHTTMGGQQINVEFSYPGGGKDQTR